MFFLKYYFHDCWQELRFDTFPDIIDKFALNLNMEDYNTFVEFNKEQVLIPANIDMQKNQFKKLLELKGITSYRLIFGRVITQNNFN